jgi:predicted transposase YdaD
MSTYDQLIREGEIKGKLEGKLEVILKGLDNGLSVPLLATMTSMSEADICEVLEQQNQTFNLSIS